MGPAGRLGNVQFDPYSPRSLEEYVAALVEGGYGCFGLDALNFPWMPVGQQGRLRLLVADAGLAGWHFGGGHVLDEHDFLSPHPHWNAARAVMADRARFARDAGLRGAILVPPRLTSQHREEVECHFADVQAAAPGCVWVRNSARISAGVNTAEDLAEFCRATGVRPVYHASAHVHHGQRPPGVDTHRQALRLLGVGTPIVWDPISIRGGEVHFLDYDFRTDATQPTPLQPLVEAAAEEGGGSPILVRGRSVEDVARHALAILQGVMGAERGGRRPPS